MDVLHNLAFGFEHALTWQNLMFCAIGCTVGTLVGLLPGLGPLATISILLPLTYSIPTTGGGYAAVDIGDIVDFYNASMIYRGQVESAGTTGVKIKVLNKGDVFTVDPQAITNVVEKSAASEKEQDDAIRRYFSLIYPGNPKMTEIISPNSSKPVRDPRPLKVEPIEVAASTAVGASVSASAVNVGSPARPTKRALSK